MSFFTLFFYIYLMSYELRYIVCLVFEFWSPVYIYIYMFWLHTKIYSSSWKKQSCSKWFLAWNDVGFLKTFKFFFLIYIHFEPWSLRFIKIIYLIRVGKREKTPTASFQTTQFGKFWREFTNCDSNSPRCRRKKIRAWKN